MSQTEQATKDDRLPEAEVLQALSEANTLVRNGDNDGAVRHVLETLGRGGIGIVAITGFYNVICDAGRDDIAKDMRENLIAAMDMVEKDPSQTSEDHQRNAQIRVQIDDFDGAERVIQKALALDNTDYSNLFLYCLAMLRNGTFDLSRIDPEPILARLESPVTFLSGLASLMANYGRPEDALTLLDRCESHCKTTADRSRIETLRAGLTDQDPDIDQREMATGLFDKFAESYDEKLASLGNNGPQVIGRALDELALTPDQSLDIFDAGCGTGLCAPYLRPFAKSLHGVDLSIPMLVKCRDKGSFDLLTRTDLAARDTFPDGATFDMAVSGDVLVYFGALDTVFQNIFDILRPGGRFIFTVEEAPAPAPERGYAYTPSGRNHHTEDYVKQVLARVGFGPAELVIRDTLRFEFGKAVAGLAISACKPA